MPSSGPDREPEMEKATSAPTAYRALDLPW
jgi:hypothetical protein